MAEHEKPDQMERRKYPRLDVILIAYAQLGMNDSKQTYFTRNISAGGLCLLIHQNIEVGEEVLLQLNIQDGEAIINAKGKVVWNHKIALENENDKRYDVGIEFIEIASGNRQRIYEYVTQYSKE